MSTLHCGWCGRPVSAYITHRIDVDHGPTEIVWCRDVSACTAARRTQRYSRPARIPTP